MRANNKNDEPQNEKKLGLPIQRFLELEKLEKKKTEKTSSSQEDVTGKSRVSNL